MSLRAIQQLEKRALQLESRQKREKLKEQLTMDKVIGFTTAGVTSAVAGYVDGRFDLSDKTEGDGVRVMGAPVMPIAAFFVAGVGLGVGGAVGSALGFGGLGIGCGWSYAAMQKKGFEAGVKAALEKESK